MILMISLMMTQKMSAKEKVSNSMIEAISNTQNVAYNFIKPQISYYGVVIIKIYYLNKLFHTNVPIRSHIWATAFLVSRNSMQNQFASEFRRQFSTLCANYMQVYTVHYVACVSVMNMVIVSFLCFCYRVKAVCLQLYFCYCDSVRLCT